jgi:hypothetical protein
MTTTTKRASSTFQNNKEAEHKSGKASFPSYSSLSVSRISYMTSQFRRLPPR